jgi:hypothetical protein
MHKTILQSRKRDVWTHSRTPSKSHSTYSAFLVFISYIPLHPFTSPSSTTCFLEKSTLLTPHSRSNGSPSHLTLSVSLISSFLKSVCWIGIRRYVQIARKRSLRSTPVGFVAYTSMFHGRRGWMRRMKGSGGSHAKRKKLFDGVRCGRGG